MTNRLTYVLATTLIAIHIDACSPTASPTPTTLEEIRLPMGYITNVQFAPFYVAVERGYFAEEGIELGFDYSFETDGMKLVGAGEIPFSLQSGEQVPIARAQGLPVVYVLQWWQRFPVVVVSLAEQNINDPTDLQGKRIGTPLFGGASYIGWQALVQSADLDPTGIELQDVGYAQVAALTEGQVDAAIVYRNNEPIQLERAGFEVDLIEIAEYANLVSNGIVTNEETIAERPELVSAMLRAFLRGLQDSIDDPDAAFEICKRYIDGLGSDPEVEAIQREVLTASILLWRAESPGFSDPAAWETTLTVLEEMELLKEPMPPADIYTNHFVETAGETP
jgi:NitT/TauT family transport system substrate-binding protein